MTDCKSLKFFSFCLGATLSSAQDLLLTLCSGVSPGDTWGPYIMSEIKLACVHVRKLSLALCTISLVPKVKGFKIFRNKKKFIFFLQAQCFPRGQLQQQNVAFRILMVFNTLLFQECEFSLFIYIDFSPLSCISAIMAHYVISVNICRHVITTCNYNME